MTDQELGQMFKTSSITEILSNQQTKYIFLKLYNWYVQQQMENNNKESVTIQKKVILG